MIEWGRRSLSSLPPSHVIGGTFVCADKTHRQGCILCLDGNHEVAVLDAASGAQVSDKEISNDIKGHMEQLKERFSWCHLEAAQSTGRRVVDIDATDGDLHNQIWLDDDLRFKLTAKGSSLELHDQKKAERYIVMHFPDLISTVTLNRSNGSLCVSFRCEGSRPTEERQYVCSTFALVKFSHNRIPVSLFDFVNSNNDAFL
jgi:hypothetical protein